VTCIRNPWKGLSVAAEKSSDQMDLALVVIEVYTFIKLVPGMLLASFKPFHKSLNEMKSPMLRPYINNVYLIVV